MALYKARDYLDIGPFERRETQIRQPASRIVAGTKATIEA